MKVVCYKGHCEQHVRTILQQVHSLIVYNRKEIKMDIYNKEITLNESTEMAITSLSIDASTLTNGGQGSGVESHGGRLGDWPTY